MAVAPHGYTLQQTSFDIATLRAQAITRRDRAETTRRDHARAPRQARILSGTHILLAAHGAAMTNIPLLPDGAVVIEMFNCGAAHAPCRQRLTVTARH